MIIRHEAYDLSAQNTFGMKVSCRLYVEVTEPEDLLTLDFDTLPQPLFVMGGGSNLLFTGDFPGTVLHMANTGIRFLDSALSTKAEGRVEKSYRLRARQDWLSVNFTPGADEKFTDVYLTGPARLVEIH